MSHLVDSRLTASSLSDSRQSGVTIDLTGVTRTYRRGGAPALDDITLAIDAGSLVAVTGPSGSGKSTLLNLIGGLDVPSAGRIVIGGRNLGSLDETARSLWRRTDVGFVFQAYHLLPTLTCAANVALPLHLQRLKRADVATRVADALEQVGLEKRATHLPDELSGGERQRAAIARALVTSPGLVLADEPTGNLDSGAGEQVLTLLVDRTRARGATLVLVTHNPDAAGRCDRLVRLRDGRLVGDHRP